MSRYDSWYVSVFEQIESVSKFRVFNSVVYYKTRCAPMVLELASANSIPMFWAIRNWGGLYAIELA